MVTLVIPVLQYNFHWNPACHALPRNGPEDALTPTAALRIPATIGWLMGFKGSTSAPSAELHRGQRQTVKTMVMTSLTSQQYPLWNEAPEPCQQPSRLFTVLGCVTAVPVLGNIAARLMETTTIGIDPLPFVISVGLVGLTWLVCANQNADATATARQANRALEAALAASEDQHEALRNRCAELEQLLTTDPLTGVHNRRGLETDFAAVMAEPGSDTVMALLDIDHFKKINDTFGHAAGDRALKDFSRLLRARLNDSLPVYRVGGEEFVVLFPKAQMATVAALLDNFRADLQLGTFTRVQDRIPVSFSAGLAQVRETGADFSEMFKLADDRLYAAKTAGRGRTVFLDAAPCEKVQVAA